jgi:hypothetical protein
MSDHAHGQLSLPPGRVQSQLVPDFVMRMVEFRFGNSPERQERMNLVWTVRHGCRLQWIPRQTLGRLLERSEFKTPVLERDETP